ncbi:unnamed protein product, partial [Amoebophrya sp. A120]
DGITLNRFGGLLHAQRDQQGRRPVTVGFSGDVVQDWSSLAFQPEFTTAASNVAFPYWSHDIGGFLLPVDNELLTRWIQFGALSPVLR